MDPQEQPFLEHLEELRSVLLKASIGVIVGFLLCYSFSEEIMHFLERPLFDILPPDQRRLYFTSPLEKFLSFLKISVAAGLLLSSPWILLQTWRFVAPGLYQKERRMALPVILLGPGLFLLGSAFAYWVAIPYGLKFLMELGGSMDGAIITYSAYLEAVLTLILVFGIVFQIPLLLALSVFMGILSRARVSKARPHIYVGLAIAAALLTPPDPFTMLALYLPMILLFEITMLLLIWKK